MAKGDTGSRKQFALVRWTEDEMVGVMPISAVMKDYTPYVGAVVKMKWRGKKAYEAEILKISGKLFSNAGCRDCLHVTACMPDQLAAGLLVYMHASLYVS